MWPSVVADHTTGTIVVAPSGELDLHTSHDLRSALLEACIARVPVVVDLSLVTFIDSSALGVLTAVHRRLATKGCSLVIVGASARVVTALRHTGLLSFLEVRPLGSKKESGLG